jgi:hypothetical protein
MRFAFNAARLADFSYFRLYLGSGEWKSGGVEEWRSGGRDALVPRVCTKVEEWRTIISPHPPLSLSPPLPLSLTGESRQ